MEDLFISVYSPLEGAVLTISPLSLIARPRIVERDIEYSALLTLYNIGILYLSIICVVSPFATSHEYIVIQSDRNILVMSS